MAEAVVEADLFSLTTDEVVSKCDKIRRYCKRIEEEFGGRPPFYIGVDCRHGAGDLLLEWLDESRAFELLLREGEHVVVPSNATHAFDTFMRMMEECYIVS